ncbi:hypothetical protein EJB05_22100, partial [Eragrostis curvula]
GGVLGTTRQRLPVISSPAFASHAAARLLTAARLHLLSARPPRVPRQPSRSNTVDLLSKFKHEASLSISSHADMNGDYPSSFFAGQRCSSSHNTEAVRHQPDRHFLTGKSVGAGKCMTLHLGRCESHDRSFGYDGEMGMALCSADRFLGTTE